MLQQTQVRTVVPYYHRFLERFPDVHALAAASLDEVLALWSGLGYYSRARNLHRAARQVVEQGGRLPHKRQALAELPGIGRSTAAAIAVFSASEREAILDGNVKRVLSRCFAVGGWPGDRAVEDRLWELAESLLPARNIEIYTQALMDLGTGVCTRTKPRCAQCPLAANCKAKRLGRQSAFPGAKPRKELPHRRTVMLLVLSGGRVLLEKRPPRGIWGGLWSLPEFGSRAEALRRARDRFGGNRQSHRELQSLQHGFTHFRLTIVPLLLQAAARTPRTVQPGMAWIVMERALASAIPSPVRTLLERVRVTERKPAKAMNAFRPNAASGLVGHRADRAPARR
jgi:A/G-specific adenine glycosylase